MTEEEAMDLETDWAWERAKEERHEAQHTITLSGTEANLIMNYLYSTYPKESTMNKEVEQLRLKFHNLYFNGKFK